MFLMPKESRKKLGRKAMDYVASEFSFQKTVDSWHNDLTDLIENWKLNRPKTWNLEEIK